MSDDERNALANIKNAEAIDLLIQVIEAGLVPTTADATKLTRAKRLSEEASQLASGVDRGSLKGKQP